MATELRGIAVWRGEKMGFRQSVGRESFGVGNGGEICNFADVSHLRLVLGFVDFLCQPLYIKNIL